MKLLIDAKNLGLRKLEFKDKKTGNPYNVFYVSLYQPGEAPFEVKIAEKVAEVLEDMKNYLFIVDVNEYEGRKYFKITGLK